MFSENVVCFNSVNFVVEIWYKTSYTAVLHVRKDLLKKVGRVFTVQNSIEKLFTNIQRDSRKWSELTFVPYLCVLVPCCLTLYCIIT